MSATAAGEKPTPITLAGLAAAVGITLLPEAG
jgi:hypothetical protein